MGRKSKRSLGIEHCLLDADRPMVVLYDPHCTWAMVLIELSELADEDFVEKLKDTDVYFIPDMSVRH